MVFLISTRRTALLAAVLGAYAASMSQASPLESNPITPVANIVPLDHYHPAFGGLLPPWESERAPWSADKVTPANPRLRTMRRMEATNADVRRLESFFNSKMETNFNKLATSYEVKPTPWPGDYWAVVRDGINARWDGQPSPSEKYAKAFGLNVKEFQDTISSNNGIDSQSWRTECKTYSDCSHLKDGSSCGKREGHATGRCIPSWFGICHAWAPAALLEPEPICPVKKNGVTFELVDIKALITQVYDGANVGSVFTGMRYDGPDDDTDAMDKYGRYKNAARRDLGPGFFHIAMTNVMNRFKRSFVLDVASGSEVWNQPVRGYQVQQKNKMSAQEAAKKYYNTDKYPFNDAAVNVMYVQNHVTWILESNTNEPTVLNGDVDMYTGSADYEYLLELDGNDNILGGEWLSYSNEAHPDFLWFPVGKPQDGVMTDVGLSYANVRGLLEESIRGNCSRPSA